MIERRFQLYFSVLGRLERVSYRITVIRSHLDVVGVDLFFLESRHVVREERRSPPLSFYSYCSGSRASFGWRLRSGYVQVTGRKYPLSCPASMDHLAAARQAHYYWGLQRHRHCCRSRPTRRKLRAALRTGQLVPEPTLLVQRWRTAQYKSLYTVLTPRRYVSCTRVSSAYPLGLSSTASGHSKLRTGTFADSLTDKRLDLFFWGPYASQHIGKLLDRARYVGDEYVKMSLWSAPGDSKPSFEEAVGKLSTDGQEVKVGHRFGSSWSNHWVRVDMKIPTELRNVDQDVICAFR